MASGPQQIHPWILALNAGRSFGNSQKFHEFLDSLRWEIELDSWAILYISEFDGSFRELVRGEEVLHEIESGHLFARFYAGPSSVSQAVVVHRDHTTIVKCLQWCGRAVHISLKHPVSGEGVVDCLPLRIIGVHSPHEHQADFYGNLKEKFGDSNAVVWVIGDTNADRHDEQSEAWRAYDSFVTGMGLELSRQFLRIRAFLTRGGRRGGRRKIKNLALLTTWPVHQQLLRLNMFGGVSLWQITLSRG